MNVASERAREACDSCRKSHKKCTYDDDSTRCLRCEKRNTPCSLFLSVDVVQQGPPVALGSAPDSWAGTPPSHGPASSNYSYYPQGEYYYPTHSADNTQGRYSTDMIFQSVSHANQHESEQPAMNQDGLYGHNNVFNDHDGT